MIREDELHGGIEEAGLAGGRNMRRRSTEKRALVKSHVPFQSSRKVVSICVTAPRFGGVEVELLAKLVQTVLLRCSIHRMCGEPPRELRKTKYLYFRHLQTDASNLRVAPDRVYNRALVE